MNKKRLKIAYVPPQTEVCAAEPYKFLAASPIGGEHNVGGNDGEITGAKGFGLTDEEMWGDLWDDELWEY